MHKKHRKDLIKSGEVSPGRDWRQNSDVNGRKGMVLIRRLGKTITGIIWHQVKIRLRVEVAVIEGRGAYQRRRFEGGTDIIPPA